MMLLPLGEAVGDVGSGLLVLLCGPQELRKLGLRVGVRPGEAEVHLDGLRVKLKSSNSRHM